MTGDCVTDETLSAFVDDALSGAERDQVASHLATCARCRGEVAELRSVQQLLGSAGRTPRTTDLGQRLVSIAGSGADQPLWARSFDHPLTGPAPLPSSRQARRRGVGTAVVLVTVLVVGIVGLGWSAAPPPNPTIVNPVTKARAEFAHVAAQRPFVMDSAVAVWAMSPRDQEAFADHAAISPLPITPGQPLTSEEARTILTIAEQAPRIIDHSSQQRIHVHRTGGVVSMTVDVQHRAAQGTQIQVVAGDGEAIRTAFVPTPGAGSVAVLEDISGRRDQSVLGREAIVIELRRSETLVARWWVDRRTGMQLAQETYGADGAVQLQAVVTELDVQRHDFLAHPPPRLVRPVATADLRLAQAAEVRAAGWTCHSTLAGLPLTRLGSDPGTAVHTTYSDGASAITVRQERGTIIEAPEGFTWDPTIGAYRRDGAPSMLIWQSRDSVFTVVTDGSPELAAQAAAELPHEQPVMRTRVGRVHEGWQRLADMVTGR